MGKLHFYSLTKIKRFFKTLHKIEAFNKEFKELQPDLEESEKIAYSNVIQVKKDRGQVVKIRCPTRCL